MRSSPVGVLAAFALGAVACQTYDFDPVRPLAVDQTVKVLHVVAHPPRPNLFLMVDKSGSMNFSADPNPACTASCGSTGCSPTSGCRTRLGELKKAMDLFLTSAGSIAHMGMLPFPNVATSACGAASVADIPATGVELNVGPDDDVALQATASAVNARIQALAPSGGTPTGPSLRSLSSYQPLLDKSRQNYVLLLTDGLPNCNPALDAQLRTCACTAGSIPPGTDCAVGGLNQCLDRDGTMADITALLGSDIHTIVVGFGAELATGSGQAVDTLSALGNAGGYRRPCASDAQCGTGDSCSAMGTDNCGKPSKVCARTFFTAQTADELSAALTAIGDSIVCFDPCTQPLNSRPSGATSAEREQLVSVIIDGVNVPPGPNTWSYDDARPAVVFPDGTPYCTALLNSTSLAPVNLEIRMVRSL